MSESSPNPYLRTKVQTASPGELRLMLLDGAVRFLEQGIQGLKATDHEMTYTGISRCQHIVMELLSSLRPDEAPELCERLSSLYTFMYLQLVTACTDRNLPIAESVLELLRYERETWSMLLERLTADGEIDSDPSLRSDAGTGSETSKSGSPDSGGSDVSSDRILGGNVSLKV